MTLTVQDGYIFNGTVSELTEALKKLAPQFAKAERQSHVKKMGIELANFLDSSYRNSISLLKLDQWLVEQEDNSLFEMKTVRVWFSEFNKRQCLIKFFNLSESHRSLAVKNLELIEYNCNSTMSNKKELKIRINNWSSLLIRNKWENSGFIFTLYAPEHLTIDKIFKNMPSLSHRQFFLAEKTIGNQWINRLPQNEIPLKLFESLKYLKTEEGKKSVKTELRKIKTQILIYKLEQIKVG